MSGRVRPIHAVVVAYHATGELDACLAAVEGSLPITVVDNSCSAMVCEVAQRRGADYLDPGENLGFGAGANLALRQLLEGPPQDVLLLNPDAILLPSQLRLLAECLHGIGNERVGIVSPRLVDDLGAHQRVVWPFPTPARAWTEAVGFGHFPARRTFVAGAVVVLRWEAIAQVGLFDERFFLYAEEADWQRRALRLGWSSRLCTAAAASHVGAGTSTDPYKREALFHAAQETYIRKWYGSAGWWVYRAGACLGAAARATVFGGERRAQAARRALIYFRGPRRCAALARD